MNQTDTTQILQFANKDYNEFIILLLATLIGVLVGFGFVMWWDRRKKKIEIRETKKRVLTAILVELQDNKKGIDNWHKNTNQIKWDITKHGFEGGRAILSFGTYESAKNSGNLSMLEPNLQVSLDNINNRVQNYMKIQDQIIGFSTSATFSNITYADVVATNLISELSHKMKELDDDLVLLLPILDNAVKNIK